MRSEFTQAETASDIAAKAEIAAPAALNAESKLPHSRKTNERYAIPPGTSGISATMSTAAFSRTNRYSKLHAIYAATTAANSEKNTKLFGKNKNRVFTAAATAAPHKATGAVAPSIKANPAAPKKAYAAQSGSSAQTAGWKVFMGGTMR